MPSIALIDALLWGITLAVSLFGARAVYRQRDLPACLFLGMVVALVIPQVHYTLALLTVLTTLIVVFLALPLRDAIQHLTDRLFLRRQASYRRLLQDFSRALTTPVALPRLLTLVAGQIEEVFHPSGLAMALNGGNDGYQIVLSQGKLASQPVWQEGTRFAIGHIVPVQMAARRHPLYLPWHVRDAAAQHEPAWLEVEAAGVQLLIPMHLRGSLIGWIALGPRLSDLSYSQQDLEFLSALADQACVALDNARLYDEMQRRATELAMVAMVSSAISSSLDLEQVLQTIVESVTQVVNCGKSAIFELGEDGQHLSLRMSRGLSQAYQTRSQHLDVSSSNRALAITTGQPFIVPDIQAEPRLVELEAMAQQEEYRAVVDLPLVGREGLLGVLSVYFDEVHNPTAGELEVLTTFASQATIAIENARLYATATRERDRATRLYEQTDAALAQRVEELTAIEEISRRLTGTLDLQQVMSLVLEQSLQATQADRGVISLYSPERHSLQLLSQTGYPEHLERYRIEPWPDDRGITGRVARSGQPALIPDVSQDPDYVPVAATTRSQVSVPIIHEGRVIGIITLESDRLAAFRAEHLRFAGLLADHAAIGINNAQLFQQVIEGRDRLQTILNSTRDAVIVFDTAGYMILINPRVRELLGAEVERWLLSKSLLEEFQVPDSLLFQLTDLSLEHLAQLRTQTFDHPDQVAEVAFNFRSGSERLYLEATASPVPGEAGEVLGWVAVLRDMTRQQELEQFREDLTSMVIHNLQGPLAAVISSLETLSEFPETDRAMARELLGIAQNSAQKLYGRIESVLWLRQLEDSQMPLNQQSLPLQMVAQPVIDEYAPLAANVGVSLEIDYGQELPPIFVDEEMIGRVFSNLLDNALKFTPSGGRIRLHAALQDNEQGQQVLCAVVDTGPGISEEAKAVIFGKFRRANQVASGRRRGMGIGLHYCRLAVEAHGGHIWVESRSGEGSTFYFTLPVSGEAA